VISSSQPTNGKLVRLGGLKQAGLGEGRLRRFAVDATRPASLAAGPHAVLVTVEGRRRVKRAQQRGAGR
jgi:hypothetical protein